MPSDLEQLRCDLEDAIAGASDNALSQAPEGKWNSAQILEHLFLTYKNTNYGLKKCLEKGVPLATSATLKHRVATLLVVDLGYLPKGREAPQRAMPRGMSPAEVRTAIFAEIEKMVSGFADCERCLGIGTKIMDHPFLGPLTAGEWRKFHFVHGQHHTKQIRERIRR